MKRRWLIIVTMALVGCSKPEAPKSAPDMPVVASRAGAAEASVPAAKPAPDDVSKSTKAPDVQVPAAKPIAPSSLVEAARVIDLRTFPMLDSEVVADKVATVLSYHPSKADLVQGVQFYRPKLTAAGWKIAEDSFDKDKGYWVSSWSKDGYVLRLNIVKDPNSGKWLVYAQNMGNVDARTLPRPAGTELKQDSFYSAIYLTNEKLEDVVKLTREELGKHGWRVLKSDRADSDGASFQTLNAIQRGCAVVAMLQKRKGSTEVMYGVSLLREELPIMPEVLGSIEHRDEPLLLLKYVAKAGMQATLDFHRKEMPALGWKLREDTDKIDEKGAATVWWDAPEKEPLRLELLAINEGHTAVRVLHAKQ